MENNILPTPQTTDRVVAARFATGMRADSFATRLAAAGIPCKVVAYKWTNKRLPPPKLEVLVNPEHLDAATKIYQDKGSW